MNPYKNNSEIGSSTKIKYEDIATKLLQDNFLLTALELHTELIESGKELPQLRQFFSNPANFEQNAASPQESNLMQRTPSQNTLDSLDLARYSEDGGGAADRSSSVGELAVLEFELRKAKETINALRASLTQAADCNSSMDKDMYRDLDEKNIKSHEKKALNYLINEYLLDQNYKLTSITFSDENPDQDFEDWDDVGLNIPKPPGLLALYKGHNIYNKDRNNVVDSGKTDSNSGICLNCQASIDETQDWSHEVLIQAEEIKMLKEKIIALETEKINFQKQYDAALLSLNLLTTPVSENKTLESTLSENISSVQDTVSTRIVKPITSTATENYYGSNASTNSGTPDHFEIIDPDKNSGSVRQEGSSTSWCEARGGAGSQHGSVATLDDAISMNDTGEWTRVQCDAADTAGKDVWINSSNIPEGVKRALLGWVGEGAATGAAAGPAAGATLGSDLLSELAAGDKPLTHHGLLALVADTLPRILPHTLVSRRCEAAALLACTVHLLTSQGPAAAARRAKNLHLLLTLLKKPDALEAKVIIEAVSLIVRWSGSGEVLSCIAELLASRSTERRVFASQVCLNIAPYVGVDLCSSLLLSIVACMCEAPEPDVRLLGLKAAALVCPVAENKYAQLEGILSVSVRDPCEQVVRDCVRCYAPVLARTALNVGKYSSDLCTKLLTNLKKASQDKDWKSVQRSMDIFTSLIPPSIIYMLNVQIVRNTLPSVSGSERYQEISLQCENTFFIDKQCYLNDSSLDAKLMLLALSKLCKENQDVRWQELDDFSEMLDNILQSSVTCQCINHVATYEKYMHYVNLLCENLTSDVTRAVIVPIFSRRLEDIERRIDKLQPVENEETVIVGIYMAGVLMALDDWENLLHEFLQRWIVCVGVCGLPGGAFSTPVRWLARRKPAAVTPCLRSLREVSASSHASKSGGLVRALAAGVLGALAAEPRVHDHCLEAELVPAVLALLHDDDSGVRESALEAWGSVTRLCASRGLGVAEHCWAALEHLLTEGAPVTAREAARAADALATVFMPNPEAAVHVPPDKGVELLCSICERVAPSADMLGAVLPALQLAAHHAHLHALILPALRKLDERIAPGQLAQYKQAIDALRSNIGMASSHGAGAGAGGGGGGGAGEAARGEPRPPGLLAAHEAVGRRVSQMFQHSRNNMNIPNIFRKKS